MRDRLVETEANIGGTTTTTQYAYDIDGIRLSKTENSHTTTYITDRNRDYAQVLTEITDGQIEVIYVQGDDLISQQRNNQLSYYLYDGLSSTRALSNASGSLTNTYNYDAFGIELNRTGTTVNGYLFTGEQFDQSLNQYYLRARYYNQSIGRFTQMDTFEGINSDTVTLHKYLYANVDPINNIDPSGNLSLGSFFVGIRTIGMLAKTSVGRSFLAQTLRLGTTKAVSSKAKGLIVLAAMAGAGSKIYKLIKSKVQEDNEKRITVYHGSLNAYLLRQTGFTIVDGTAFVSRDIAAALDAIGPHRPGIEQAKDPGLVVSNIPESAFNSLMLPFERPYKGFYPYKINSTEITLRTSAQMLLFNEHMVRY